MMTRNNTYRLAGYTFLPTDRLLFDANVWMYVYGPQGNPGDWRTSAYSKALSSALKA
jgi:hypothetical protein